MSGTNKNCHVSTKWEDTGGKNNPECDATVLRNAESNDISLQELIENELALRGSVTVSATTNGLPGCPEALICDMDRNKIIASDDNNDVLVRLSCSMPKKSNGQLVAEVDDFEVLYNEVSSEIVANGHANESESLKNSADGRSDVPPVDIPETSAVEIETPSISEATVVFDSLESQNSDPAPQHPPLDCGSDCNNSVESKSCVDCATNNTNDDFVPVSHVNVVESKAEDVRVGETTSTEHELFSSYERVRSASGDDDWIRVSDATAPEENDVEKSTDTFHDDDPNVEECDRENHVVTDVLVDSCQPAVHNESSVTSNEEQKSPCNEEIADQSTSTPLSCGRNEGSLLADGPQESEELSNQTGLDSAPQCNGWYDDEKSNPAEEVVPGQAGDEFSAYEEIQSENTENDCSRLESHLKDFSTCPRITLIESAQQSISEKSETRLIEECSYNIAHSNITYDIVSESTTAEKKTVKKKKNTSEESVTTAKTKKTKKTKKYEEKENISVSTESDSPNQNGFDDPNFHQILDDGDELSNVCVRDLKIMYCNEASKTNKLAQYEEPVPASIPIKELTRSFGDLRVVSNVETSSPQMNGTSKCVSMSDLSFAMDGVRSFREKKSVRDLATSFENLCPTRSYGSSSSQKSLDFSQSLRDRALVKTLKAGFGKFDQLTKKTVMHVRSSDPAKTQQQFSQNDSSQDSGSLCKACNKNVFAMEQIKAERHVWHKNCFRCKTCNKQLTVDVYSSHEGELFCKPHFRDLFKPKVVVEEDKPVKFRKPELIIRENQPVELPPDVVRASDKPDLGLEELSSLNVKSRFQVFEKPPAEESSDKSPICVKRSPSILSKLAKFQAKGMDVGVSSDIFNGIDYEESSSSEEEPAHDENVTRNSVTKEKPIAFNKMNDVKKNWENGQASRREERQEERRQERQNIRSRLFMGKQNKMREAYENAVAESERGNVKKDVEVKSEMARSIKEKFEKGEVLHNEESDEEHERKLSGKNEDMDVFEAGISKKSRSMFQQMDAAIKTQSNNSFSSPPTVTQNGHRTHKEVITRQVSNDVVRASDPVEEVTVETADISSKFKFFETYKAPEVKKRSFRITPPREGQLKSETPEREIQRDPEVVRSEDQVDEEVLKKSNTTAKMLSLFRQLEEAQETVPDGPKPMKKFTPPPVSSNSSEAESEDESEEVSEASVVLDDVIRSSDKTEDEYLKMAQKAAKAKALKEKFEKWEPEKQSNNNAVNLLDSEQASLDTTKSLRARFESMKAEQPTDKPRPKVNRFVDKSLPGYCDTCFKKVYALEKVEAGDKVFHRSCFKCTRCSAILRMETFTMNNGQLYCVPHFKQLFITKGNYDEGFGNDQHKAKWPVHTGVKVTNGIH